MNSSSFTDAGNAEFFLQSVGDKVAYTHSHGWLVWSGTHWQVDSGSLLVRNLLVDAIRQRLNESHGTVDDLVREKLQRWTSVSQSLTRVNSALELAKGLMAVDPTKLQPHPMHLYFRNGVLNLKTGALNPHDPKNFNLHYVDFDFDWSSRSTRWDRFVEETFPDRDTAKFAQRASGYSLTGSTSEQVLFAAYGSGANGKSVFLEVLRGLSGSNAMALNADALRAGANSSGSELARLHGKRLVLVSELPSNNRLDTALLKDITGGDLVSARFLYQQPFDFYPQCKIWLKGNYMPSLSDLDKGISRRLKVIPFVNEVPASRRVTGLVDELMQELPAIAVWAVRGAQEWLTSGLGTSVEVERATKEVLNPKSSVVEFLGQKYRLREQAKTQCALLFRDYRNWCQSNGHPPQRREVLEHELANQGVMKTKSNGEFFWKGIGFPILEQ